MQSVASFRCTAAYISGSTRCSWVPSARPCRIQLAQRTGRSCNVRGRQSVVQVQAIGGGPEDKKSLTREEEPQEYWQTASERKGANPMKDPLAIIGILAILLPFLILGVCIATGVIDVNAGRA